MQCQYILFVNGTAIRLSNLNITNHMLITIGYVDGLSTACLACANDLS